jgi:uncharacterized membrane protein
MRGPIDFIIVEFKENKFEGKILKALEKASNDGTIAVLDIGMIVKDGKGKVSSLELSQIDDSIITEFAKSKNISSGLIADDDIAEVAELLDNNSSAGLLVIEHLWAKDLKKAIIDANGTLLAEGRIHPDAEAEINKKGE